MRCLRVCVVSVRLGAVAHRYILPCIRQCAGAQDVVSCCSKIFCAFHVYVGMCIAYVGPRVLRCCCARACCLCVSCCCCGCCWCVCCLSPVVPLAMRSGRPTQHAKSSDFETPPGAGDERCCWGYRPALRFAFCLLCFVFSSFAFPFRCLCFSSFVLACSASFVCSFLCPRRPGVS